MSALLTYSLRCDFSQVPYKHSPFCCGNVPTGGTFPFMYTVFQFFDKPFSATLNCYFISLDSFRYKRCCPNCVLELDAPIPFPSRLLHEWRSTQQRSASPDVPAILTLIHYSYSFSSNRETYLAHHWKPPTLGENGEECGGTVWTGALSRLPISSHSLFHVLQKT